MRRALLTCNSQRAFVRPARHACKGCKLRRSQNIRGRGLLLRAAVIPDGTDDQAQENEGILPEDDYEVPGNYIDAMNSNTKLGKAVRAAIEELEHLGDLETEVLQQCDDLLKKLGMNGSIFGSNPPETVQPKQQQGGNS
eukprot:GHRR01001008.1.p1 GENE.GHRR01001008.1~~GHRR01001008.1.p1  ORF type:complete len:139 (+),score=34.83 GHRR01001008.1:126-542(+)